MMGCTQVGGKRAERRGILAVKKIPVYFILNLGSDVRLVIKAEDTVIELRLCD